MMQNLKPCIMKRYIPSGAKWGVLFRVIQGQARIKVGIEIVMMAGEI